MRYFHFRWSESRGDDFGSWGNSDWFFEVGEDGWPLRQVENYDSGPTLRYGPEHKEDEFGGLGHGSVDDEVSDSLEPITADVFEHHWMIADEGVCSA